MISIYTSLGGRSSFFIRAYEVIIDMCSSASILILRSYASSKGSRRVPSIKYAEVGCLFLSYIFAAE